MLFFPPWQENSTSCMTPLSYQLTKISILHGNSHPQVSKYEAPHEDGVLYGPHKSQ